MASMMPAANAIMFDMKISEGLFITPIAEPMKRESMMIYLLPFGNVGNSIKFIYFVGASYFGDSLAQNRIIRWEEC